ncbi:MAG TPA: beta-propeller fold lactonase family protein [Dehalococcoidia bacterium]|nr:beta-propeller fold lactonase family protein [Dehalococcoidia bacterium]
MATGGTFAYVSNADTRDILVLRLDLTNGSLDQVQRLELTSPGSLGPLAVSPDRRFLYAAQREAPYPVSCFTVDQLNGELTYMSRAPLPHSSPYIITDRSGRWLLAASYQGSVVSVSPISAQGFPQPPHQVIRSEPNAHSIQIDSANRHVLVPCLGGDVVMQWTFDAVTGRLAANSPAAVKVAADAGPRHFVFHPNNRRVYLLNELNASIYVFDYDPASGTLSELSTISALPPDFAGPAFGMPGVSTNGGPKAADLHVSPDGRFLYASERTSSTLAAFSIDLDSGRLEPIDHYATETTPRGFNIDPSGRYLLSVGQSSNHLTVYAIDQESGRLTEGQRFAMGQGPNWVEILRLP